MFKKKNEGKRQSETKKRRLTTAQKILIVVAVLLALALGVVYGSQKLFVHPELPGERVEDPKSEAPIREEIDYGEGVQPKASGERKSEDYYTVLILGRDTGGGGNTDTMLLASYDVTNQKATVMSIPRDTMVNVPWDVKKINSVYPWYGGGEEGVQAVYKEISQLVGFEPDYQVVVEWAAIGDIVDAMGGVYFDVPYNMNYSDPFQDLVIKVDKGYQLLDGEAAMGVIRWRHNNDGTGYPNADLGRIQTQQAFLKAVIKQLLQVKQLANIEKFVKVFQNNVETDLKFQEMLWFGQQAVLGGLKVEDVTFLTMPNKLASAYSRTVSDVYKRDMYQSYVVPDAQALLDLVNDSLSPFVEPSELKDLDIMSVNKDGSLSSSSGYVEDKVAAQPPVKRGDGKTTEEKKADEPYKNEFGHLIDPATGYIIDPATGDLLNPETGEVISSGNAENGAEQEAEAPAQIVVTPQEKPQESAPAQQPAPQKPTQTAPQQPTESTPEPEAPAAPEPPAEEIGFAVVEDAPTI